MKNNEIFLAEGSIAVQRVGEDSKKVTYNEVVNATFIQNRATTLKNVKMTTALSPTLQTDYADKEIVMSVDIAENLKREDLEEIQVFQVDKAVKNAPKGILNQNLARMLSTQVAATAVQNSTPNGAYTIDFEVLYNDTIGTTGEQRWYNFQLTEQKKLTIYLTGNSDLSIDNDLYLFKLNTETNSLENISYSKNNAGLYELLSYVADPGIYYICVAAYSSSAVNTINFLARTSATWDVQEPDDSMAMAKELTLGKIMRGTLDNAIDQDCSLFLVSKAGNYYLKFFGVPDNCNYQIQFLSSEQKLLTTIPKNEQQILTNVPEGSYYIRILAADGVVDPTVEYGLLITPIPEEITDFDKEYTLWVTEDGKHFIEYIEWKNIFLFIDGQVFDFQSELNIKTGRALGNGTHNCSGIVSSASSVYGLAMGRYAGSKVPAVGDGVQNALAISVNGYYGSYHSMKSKSLSDLSGAGSIIYSGDGYYMGVWSWTSSEPGGLTFIVNLNTGTVVDLLFKNWFYGINDYSFYGAYGFPESPSLAISGQHLKGTVLDRNGDYMSIK